MKTFEIGGTKRPFNAGLACLMEYSDLSKGHTNDPEKLIQLMAWCGFTHGAKQSGKEADFTVEDVKNWLNDDFILVAQIAQEFMGQIQSIISVNKNLMNGK